MKYKKVPSISELIKQASLGEARNMSVLPAMRFISNVTPSRSNVSNGRRKAQRPEDKKSVGEIDWNSFAPSVGRVRGIDMLFKKESYSTPLEPSPLLLDLYPDAAAAYSLRKLRTAYAGSAIRVRRSSDNTETDIGFVDNELDTVSLLDFVGAGDGFVTVWYDQSGGVNNQIQATAANQPKVVESGIVLTTNSTPTVRFDGVDDYMDYFGEVNDIITKEIYVVLNWRGSSSIAVYKGIATSLAEGYPSVYYLSSGANATDITYSAGIVFINDIETVNFSPVLNTKIIRFVRNSPHSNGDFRIAVDRGFIGSRHWSGDFSEMIVYPTNTENPNGITNNLKERNNITY